MPRLNWTPQALRDVQALYRALARRNPDAARLAVQAIRQAVQALGHHPGMGCCAQELPDGFREWMIDFGSSGYVACYRADAQATVLLAVRHQHQAGCD